MYIEKLTNLEKLNLYREEVEILNARIVELEAEKVSLKEAERTKWKEELIILRDLNLLSFDFVRIRNNIIKIIDSLE